MLEGHLGYLLASRHLKLETASAFVTSTYVVVISAPFSLEEEEVMTWVQDVDETRLLGIVPLPDGLDLMILERLHTKQSAEEACQEQIEAMQKNFSQ